ncbi:L-serine dehydratase [Gordonia effusa NBRC 100432]|uniref:L-serine dehydratase n=1 Tax=Gordonia effusa NBRC 100432 TaxID=1077974 RepID=H0QVX1_9ACTN|nr:L-serine ammonia-lyase [Gordonia effusa]GAB16972.1 L-serine dehydratase [Gordonia effusa NBRC 100432]
MTISVFDLFSVGIGPSSSHTVGPMRAASRFVAELVATDVLGSVVDIRVDLYGSLAATGAGHGTPTAILLGLEGYAPEETTSDVLDKRVAMMTSTGRVAVAAQLAPTSSPTVVLAVDDLVMHPATILPFHPNALTIKASDRTGVELLTRTYYSVGGGFVVTEEQAQARGEQTTESNRGEFSCAAELLDLCHRDNCSMSDVMGRIEGQTHTREEVRERLLHIRDVMVACEQRGISRSGTLPGTLGVRRRARSWYERLDAEDPDRRPEFAEDWVNLVALAINEENASGGRVVTAPTNGAAGIVPAVLHYAVHYTAAGRADPDDTAIRFLLAAGAIGSLYKERASISGAEVGCQGEVGSAASMAAAGLAEILGGTPEQVENAAEIAMEHSLGLTCDPIGGLVQIPCIERNAISAGKAINAARMALRGDGAHRVSLDQVIETMRITGADMSTKYKETSTGGLAVSVPVNYVEC